MPLYVNVPIDNPKYHNQTELIDVDEQTFDNAFEPKKPGTLVRIYRLFCFIFFLGPIKIIMTILSFFILFASFYILPLFHSHFKDEREFKEWACRMTHPIVRMFLFSLGVVHVKINGKYEKDTRTFVSNHLTGADAATLFHIIPCQFLANAGIKNNAFCHQACKVFDQIYVDRSKKQGATELIIEAQNDNERLPLAIFPEGRVTNGSCMLGFRSGAFVSNTPVQPVAIRYRHWLMPESMATISWVEWSFPLYVYQLFSVPFYTLEVTFLPQIVYDDSTTPQQRAFEAELKIANYLGCPALHKTNKGTLNRQ
ncbi:Lysophosphatidylcholine acyltransferase 2 [Tritrichomonas musculus]|uniref:Lysophosphatidylcholine acyltransferase 2 n=1 Tax=Tritrichomonas musculus TaxID=1915356 RepID=A0ABR2GPI5_9EUKA